MRELSPEAMAVLREAARDGQDAAAQLLADLDGSPREPEDLHVPQVIREARARAIRWWDSD